jgi:hypothetical protein
MAEKFGGFTAALTSATTSDWVRCRQGSIEVYGTFTADVEIQVQDAAGNWRAIKDGSFSNTGTSGVMALDNGAELPTRVEVTAYTSGTVNVACTADRRTHS